MYVKALINGYNFANFAKNDEFETLYYIMQMNMEMNMFGKILNEFNPDLAKTVHFNNLKRVIRYIEIEKFGNKTTKNTSILSKHNVLILCLTKEKKITL